MSKLLLFFILSSSLFFLSNYTAEEVAGAFIIIVLCAYTASIKMHMFCSSDFTNEGLYITTVIAFIVWVAIFILSSADEGEGGALNN